MSKAAKYFVYITLLQVTTYKCNDKYPRFKKLHQRVSVIELLCAAVGIVSCFMLRKMQSNIKNA